MEFTPSLQQDPVHIEETMQLARDIFENSTSKEFQIMKERI